MIEHSEESSDENDGRQHLEGEVEAEMRALLPQIAKHKLGTYKCVTQQLVDDIARLLEGATASVNSQYKHREHELQTQAPGYRFQANCAAIGRESVGQT